MMGMSKPYYALMVLAVLLVLVPLVVFKHSKEHALSTTLLYQRKLLFGFGVDPKTIESKEEGVNAVTGGPLPAEGSDDLDISYINRNWNSRWRWSKVYNHRNPNGVLLEERKEFSKEQAWSIQELFEHFPIPHSADTIRLYNQRAWQEFRYLLLNDNQHQVNICINGGSTSAGGGHIVSEDRYYSQFFKYIHHLIGFNNPTAETTFDIQERSHGARGSLHSAVFAHNFIPQNTDILIWEFAINDSACSGDGNDQRSVLIGWLREIEKIQAHPPKVILVYLHFLADPTYEAHAMIAKQFDFVVGHINVASYLDETRGSLGLLSERDVYVVDGIHASNAGHLTVAYLLLNLLKGNGPWTLSAPPLSTASNDISTRYKWTCDTNTEDHLFVKSKVVDETSVSGWRSPKGAATLELPQNQGVVGSPRQMFFDIGPNEKVKTVGKADPARTDRQVITIVPCCGTGLYTTVSLHEQWRHMPLQNATALWVAFHHQYNPRQKKFEFKVEIENSTQERKRVGGNFFWVKQRKECSWSFFRQLKTGWFGFEEPQHDIMKVHLCVSNEECFARHEEFSGAMLSGLAVY
mmetsp:Transcript_17592/g.38094  ORF Transcript_17592/g.38094 Transcript_17592/m.38094 type:complete len:578 (+) Transcript_17592:58-1791(+)